MIFFLHPSSKLTGFRETEKSQVEKSKKEEKNGKKSSDEKKGRKKVK